MTHPACLTGLLIQPIMQDNEAVGIIGAVEEAIVSGYSRSLRYEGVVRRRVPSTLTAIDALSFKATPPWKQWTPGMIHRELAKVRVSPTTRI